MIKLKSIFSLSSFVLAFYLADSSLAAVASEKKIMDEARSAYASNQLDQALSLYLKIPQTSDFWVEALEERAWTHLRKGEDDKALSLVTTLTSELLAPQVGPEPYFLRGLIDYKLCNIKGIFQDFDLFKKRYQARSDEIAKLQKTKSNLGSNKVLEILKDKKAKLSQLKADDFGTNVQYLPRYFYRDKTILVNAQSGNDQRLLQRMAQLAEDENKEINQILQKMQLLESQVVQQVFAYKKQMSEKREAHFTNKDKDSLVFPYKPGEGDMWIDELDNFEAATTDCPVDPLKGSTL